MTNLRVEPLAMFQTDRLTALIQWWNFSERKAPVADHAEWRNGPSPCHDMFAYMY